MHLSTLDHLPGYRTVRAFGLVHGSTVRSKHLGRDIMAGLKTLVGGELRGYTELMEEARAEALSRLQDGARALGANAVLGLRFGTTSITDGASEIVAYGTAVVVEPPVGGDGQAAAPDAAAPGVSSGVPPGVSSSPVPASPAIPG